MVTEKEKIKLGAKMLLEGHGIIIKAIVRAADRTVNRYPYAFIVAIMVASILIAAVSIGQARAERDRSEKQYYELLKQTEGIGITQDCFNGLEHL